MIPIYATQFGLTLRLPKVGVQKIDGIALKTHEITKTGFLV